MTERAKAMKKLYCKEWRRNHPDKVKAYQEKYWEKKAAEYSAEQEAIKDKDAAEE